MRNRRPRRFKYRSTDREHQRRNFSEDYRIGSTSFSNGRGRKNSNNHLSAEKLFEKYNTLAKEAPSSGDKTLSENYFQHADHFARIIGEKILNHKNHLSQQDPIKEKEIVTDESKTENVETNPKNIENNSGHNTK